MGLRAFLLICLLLLADAQKWPVNGDCQPCQCYYKMTIFGRMRSVNCSDKGLKGIPPNLPRDLTALDLSWNPLDGHELRENLCKFKSLQTLTLSFTDLTSLSGILKECSTVLELNLTGNRLNQVDVKTFQGMENLRRLLGLEVETALTSDVFKELTSLKDLDLAFYGKSLPEGLFDGMVIRSLNLVLTQATSLPRGVFDFGQRTLNTLELVGERVTTLPEDLLEGLSVLRKLYLTMPSVQRLPERFFLGQQQDQDPVGPVNLQEVEITGIKTLPPGLFNQLANLETLQLKEIGNFPQVGFLVDVVNLRMLVITGSKLTSIPASWFKELYSLKTLKLSGDQLEELDENVFKGLLNLKELDLSYNNLKRVTGKLLEPLSQSLETLVLNNNFLTEISDDCMNGLRSLRFLDISENRLTNVYEESFVGMAFLSNLNINNNRLTSLPRNLFQDQMQLETLSVADNYLVEFPVAILKLKSSLVRLDLSSNEIRQVPALELCQFVYLETVNIVSNSLHCDCDLFAFTQCPNTTVQGQCQTPAEYLDMYLKDIKAPPSCRYEKKPMQAFITTQAAPTLEEQGAQEPQKAETYTNTKLNGSSMHKDAKKLNSTVVRNLFLEEELGASVSPESDTSTTPSTFSSLLNGSADMFKETANIESEVSKKTEDRLALEGGKQNDQQGPESSTPSAKEPSKDMSMLKDNKDSPPDISLGEQDSMMGDTPAKTNSNQIKEDAGQVNATADPKGNAGMVNADSEPSANNPSQRMQPSGNDEGTQGQVNKDAGEGRSSIEGLPDNGRSDDPDLGEMVDKKEQSSPAPIGQLERPEYNSTDGLAGRSGLGQAPAKAEEIEDSGGEGTTKNPEKIAFNFTISALAALLVFGCALLVVFGVRRWQHKGSYVVTNQDSEDAEMNSLGSQGSGDKACALPDDSEETPLDKELYKK
ncbi:uncharacterized protein [Littorina saxatilis]|uniref:LRRNT domain-containing protein n=2 Tax=Littorina saxatilis TaxID=31220 RepID=A0AAN9BAL6_9CAEN